MYLYRSVCMYFVGENKWKGTSGKYVLRRRNTASISSETKKESSHRDASPGNTSILNGPLPYLFPFKLQYRFYRGLISLTLTLLWQFFVRELAGPLYSRLFLSVFHSSMLDMWKGVEFGVMGKYVFTRRLLLIRLVCRTD